MVKIYGIDDWSSRTSWDLDWDKMQKKKKRPKTIYYQDKGPYEPLTNNWRTVSLILNISLKY